MDILGHIAIYGGLAVVGIVAISLLFGCFFTTEQQTVRMVTRFAKFKRVAETGLGFKWPIIDKASKPLSLRTEQHNVEVDSITLDKVSVKLTISVQSAVIPERARDAFYKLTNPAQQIESFVFDAVRSTVPAMTLDDVFQNKGHIAKAVADELTADMAEFGYSILKALVTEVEPDAKVKAAMNDINAAQREQVAAQARGDAQKTLTVKAAEGEAERRKLQGEGAANERIALARGIKESADIIREALGEGADADHITKVMFTTQGLDAMRDMAKDGKTTILFVPNNAAGLVDLLAARAVTGQVGANS